MDLRTLPVPAKPLFTAAELAGLVSMFREAGFTRRQRLAILYRQDVHGGVRNFAFISRMRGLQVLAFNEFEAALHWLSTFKESDLDEALVTTSRRATTPAPSRRKASRPQRSNARPKP